MRWFQDDCAPSGQGRKDFYGDLVEWPVPGCNQTADADGLLDNKGVTPLVLKFESLKHCDRSVEVSRTKEGVESCCQCARCAHLLCDGLRQLRLALVIFDFDRFEQVQAFIPSGLRIGFKRLFCRSHRLVDIFCRAKRNSPRNRLCSGVNEIDGIVASRVNPLTIYVEFQVLAHDHSLRIFFGYFYCVPSAYQVRKRSYLGISSEFAFGSIGT